MDALKREGIMLATLLGFGLFVLPVPIYLVGRRVIGEYGPRATPFSLTADLWAALAGGSWAAWLLVLTPYLVVQALRLAWHVLRGPAGAIRVTNPPHEMRNWRV